MKSWPQTRVTLAMPTKRRSTPEDSTTRDHAFAEEERHLEYITADFERPIPTLSKLIMTKLITHAMVGWVVGLAYFNWFATHTLHLTFAQHLFIVWFGLLPASIAIGGGFALLAKVVTYVVTGHALGSRFVYGIAAWLSLLSAFLVTQPAIEFLTTYH